VVSSGLNIFLLIALAVGLFGFGIGLMDPPWKNKASLWAGVLACLMMIATMIQLKMQMRSALSDSSKEQIEESMAQLLKIKFTIWFYISLVSFGCAAFFAYKRIKLEKEDKMIPEFDFQQESQPSS
jgi:arginine exporter protein ArgO